MKIEVLNNLEKVRVLKNKTLKNKKKCNVNDIIIQSLFNSGGTISDSKMEIADLKIGRVEENAYLKENHSDEVLAVLYFQEIYWILITNNSKGVFCFNDGLEDYFTNNLEDAFLKLSQFYIQNN